MVQSVNLGHEYFGEGMVIFGDEVWHGTAQYYTVGQGTVRYGKVGQDTVRYGKAGHCTVR